MSYFFIAQIRIKDEIEFQKYIDKAGEIFKKYNGTYLSEDNEPVILEKYVFNPAEAQNSVITTFYCRIC